MEGRLFLQLGDLGVVHGWRGGLVEVHACLEEVLDLVVLSLEVLVLVVYFQVEGLVLDVLILVVLPDLEAVPLFLEEVLRPACSSS